MSYPVLAEQSVLGAIMLDASVWPKVRAVLDADDFHDSEHRLIFTMLEMLIDKGTPVDPVTMCDYIDKSVHVIRPAFVLEMANCTPSAANVMAYADIVRKASVRRLTHRLFHQASDALDKSQASTEAIVERVMKRLKEMER